MDVATTARVIARNNMGRFISECEQAAERTVERLIDDGVEISKELAPVGYKHDPRTVPLKAGFFSQMISRTSGMWGNFARHAMPIEFGAGPHLIKGNPSLGFWWMEEGRYWVPAAIFYKTPGLQDVVHHPGNAAQPYLRPAYKEIMGKAMGVAAQEYPG